MAVDLTINTEKRKESGKESAKKLRQAGSIPCVIYGGGLETMTLTVFHDDVVDFLKHSGANTIFNLKIKGIKEPVAAMIHDYQLDPVTHELLHLDFIRVVYGQLIHVDVPVHFTGTAPGVKMGGFMDVVQREITVECLPSNIPPHIEVDISELQVNEHVSVEDLNVSEDIKILDDDHAVIVRISPPKVSLEEEEAEEEVIAEEAEPEVIGRGKKEEEEAEE